MIDRDKALAFLAEHHRGVLATFKQDGRPQLSNITYLCENGVVRVSVTHDRAKTANLRRDPRVSLHVTTPDFWPYVVAEGTARLSPVAERPDDATVDELVEVYRGIAGEHPDWDEFREAMAAEGRLVIRFEVDYLYGTT